MMKKVAVLNGRVEHIYHSDDDDTTIEGAKIEQREYEFSEQYGWRAVGYAQQPTQDDFLLDLELRMTALELGITI